VLAGGIDFQYCTLAAYSILPTAHIYQLCFNLVEAWRPVRAKKVLPIMYCLTRARKNHRDAVRYPSP